APNVFTDWHGKFGVQSAQKDPAAAQVQGWLRRGADLLSTKVTVIGVAVARSSSGKLYFCYLLPAQESQPNPTTKFDKKFPGDLTTPIKGPNAGESVPRPKNSETLVEGLVITQFYADHSIFFWGVVTFSAVIQNTSSHDMKDVTYSV